MLNRLTLRIQYRALGHHPHMSFHTESIAE
jgi:hypothetical protein